MNNRENVRQYYINQYGLNTANKIRQLECFKIKRARHLTSLAFLKRCRDNDIIPNCVRISPKSDIVGSEKILHNASIKLLRRTIHQHRSDAYFVEERISTISNDLNLTMTSIDFDKCEEITNKRERNQYLVYKQRQILKFEKLSKYHNRKTFTPNSTQKVSQSVVNLSQQTLDENTMKVLSKGLNYAPTPIKIPFEQIICNVEEGLIKNSIRKEDLETIRQDISCVLRKSKPPKQNLSKDEFHALKNLRNNKELIVLNADKGNATVVMDTSEYNNKILDLLSDETTYKKVKIDPTNKITKKTSELIVKHSNNLKLNLANLIPSCIKPPKLYGLPKIHKINVPLRPIVSQIDTPTYKLAKHLSKMLSSLRRNTEAHVKDSYHFISEIKDLHLSDDDTMVSFDIQSLFTSLPIQDCIEIVKKRLTDNNMPIGYAELLEHCLTTGYLLWNDEFYLQIDGVTMGSPISPLVADIFMEDFEERALTTAPAKPKIYKRYVDDTFAILPSNKVSAFLNHLNSIHNNIKFTMELETNNTLAFLDINIIRNLDNSLSHTVYRKPTHTDRYLNGDSHHHPSQLSTVGKSLFQRAYGICDTEHLAGELQHIKRVLRDNKLKIPRQPHRNRTKQPTVERQPIVLPYIKGVTDKIGGILKRASIKTYYKPHKKINQLLRPLKCNIPLQDAGVYKLDCDCGLSYIGQTKRSVKTRIKEHISDVKNRRTSKSAIYEHTTDKPNHFIRFDKPQILAKENRYIPRMLREAIEIKKHSNFNREDGWQVPPVWNPIINLIKSSQILPSTKSQDTVSTYCKNFKFRT